MKHTLIKILKLLSPYKWWMLLASLVGFLTIGSSIGLLMTSAYIIAKAALHPHIGELSVGIVGVRFFGISRGLLRYAERLFSHEVTFALLAKFRVWFFKSIEPLFPSKTGRFTSGDLLTRVVSDVENLEHIFIRVISPPFIALAVALAVSIIFAFFNHTLIIAFLIPYLLAGVGVPFLTYKLSAKYGEDIILLRSRLTEISLDGIEGKRELISFGKVEKHNAEFNDVNQRIIKLQRKMKLISGMNESLIGLMMNIAVITIFVASVPLVKSNLISGTSLSVLALGTMAAFEAVLPIPLALQYLNSSIKAGDRLFQITEQVVEDKEAITHELKGENIELTNVNFSYTANEEVLKEISIKINTKEKIAIIGGSGAGKSSIINLLLNFWKINSGSITIDNIDYKGISEEEIREKYSVIPQKVFLFSDTLKGNLLIAKPDATDEELWAALQKAELKEFAETLPNKLNTWIGNHGKQLSGGERKRVAIARAILRDAEIFICDEITADLDSVNEMNIINTIHSVTKEKSLIFITHRLVDMDKYNSIYLLENGEIISKGTHSHLLTNSEKYKEYIEQ
ncbi:MAG: thiol reductant ABC exporter subunit CydC [Melioribacteraceae bacterium]|nr:thiol reductant ABC exporter subunit CydC [Melioribacteraceae bacterium]